MRKDSLKAEFDKFFILLNEYTDLLLKIFEAKEIIIPPQKKKSRVNTELLFLIAIGAFFSGLGAILAIKYINLRG